MSHQLKRFLKIKKKVGDEIGNHGHIAAIITKKICIKVLDSSLIKTIEDELSVTNYINHQSMSELESMCKEIGYSIKAGKQLEIDKKLGYYSKYDPKYDSKYDSKYYSNYDFKFDSKYDPKYNPKYDFKYDSKYDSKHSSKCMSDCELKYESIPIVPKHKYNGSSKVHDTINLDKKPVKHIKSFKPIKPPEFPKLHKPKKYTYKYKSFTKLDIVPKPKTSINFNAKKYDASEYSYEYDYVEELNLPLSKTILKEKIGQFGKPTKYNQFNKSSQSKQLGLNKIRNLKSEELRLSKKLLLLERMIIKKEQILTNFNSIINKCVDESIKNDIWDYNFSMQI
jgi:hypothetical protein